MNCSAVIHSLEKWQTVLWLLVFFILAIQLADTMDPPKGNGP